MQCDDSLQVVDVGVDWLTATVPRDGRHGPLKEFARSIMQDEASNGNNERNWKGQGYHGVTCGAVSFGVRATDAILRLSSHAAAIHYRKAILLTDNVSRMDLQLTATDSTNQADRAHLAYYQVDSAPRKGGRPPTASLRINNTGGQTLYIGSRASDKLGRLYDKGVEKKSAEKGALWRYEVEYKRHEAKRISERASQEEFDNACIAANVVHYFSTRGVTVPMVAAFDESSFERARAEYKLDRESDDERSLRWLNQFVASTVRRLIESGRRSEVLRALGVGE